MGKTMLEQIEAASAKRNANREIDMTAATAQIVEFARVADTSKLECCLCHAKADPERHGAGWWQVALVPVCPACIDDSDGNAKAVQRRVLRHLERMSRQWIEDLACVPIIDSIGEERGCEHQRVD